MEKLPQILLVDDDDTTNFLNSSLIQRLGVSEQIRVAHNGQEALALLTDAPPYTPTLLLLDVSMPGMDGIEFLEAYKRLPAGQQQATVVVMLTTYMDSADLIRLNDLPIAGLVSKPLNREKLDTLLQLHFQRQLPADIE